VTGFGGANKVVVRNQQPFPQFLKGPHNRIHIALWVNTVFTGFSLDLLAMLIRTGQEKNIVPPHPPVAGYAIGRHSRIGMTDMKFVTGKIDGCRHIISSIAHKHSSGMNRLQITKAKAGLDSFRHFIHLEDLLYQKSNAAAIFEKSLKKIYFFCKKEVDC
jgi:hypothetical protein